jgi:hypothetical protein
LRVLAIAVHAHLRDERSDPTQWLQDNCSDGAHPRSNCDDRSRTLLSGRDCSSRRILRVSALAIMVAPRLLCKEAEPPAELALLTGISCRQIACLRQRCTALLGLQFVSNPDPPNALVACIAYANVNQHAACSLLMCLSNTTDCTICMWSPILARTAIALRYARRQRSLLTAT